MIINKMTASFGRLENEELILEDGLNIICKENETGKSTWCAFIKAMLYGINSSERDKAGYLAEKTKYRPWGGYPMEGRMEITHEGKQITLIRRSAGSGLLGNCEAFYTGTNEKCLELSVKSPGDVLAGVPESVFKRSAFILRPSISIDTDAELEKRISALVSTGDEETSFSEASKRLTKWRNARVRKPGGLIPQAEHRKLETELSLKRLESENMRLSGLRDEKARLSARREELKLELDACRNNEIQSLKERLTVLRDEEETLKAEIAGLTKTLSPNGRLINAETIKETENIIEEYEESTEQLERLKKILADADDELYNLEEEKDRSGKRSMYSAVIALIGVIFAFLDRYISIPYFWVFGAALIVFALISFVFEARGASISSAERKAKLKILELKAVDAQDRYDTMQKTVREALKRAQGYLLRIEQHADFNDRQAILKRAGESLVKLENAKFKYEQTKENADRLESLVPAGLELSSARAVVPHTEEEAKKLLEQTERELSCVSSELSMAEGELKHLGDPLVLSGELEKLKENIYNLGIENSALELAAATLEDANLKLQNRFSPIVGKLSSEYMNRLTAGRYTGVLFGKSMNFSAESADEMLPRDALYLSGGTVDQMYLAVRVAISELILGKKCPLVLDDVLACFDDERTAIAMRLIEELAEKRQIVFFTCRKRETLTSSSAHIIDSF